MPKELPYGVAPRQPPRPHTGAAGTPEPTSSRNVPARHHREIVQDAGTAVQHAGPRSPATLHRAMAPPPPVSKTSFMHESSLDMHMPYGQQSLPLHVTQGCDGLDATRCVTPRGAMDWMPLPGTRIMNAMR
eukprot:364388-Chlamydomonas_euryale.AAC.8